TLHGLAKPPGGVGGELEALAPVELLDGSDQTQVSFLDQIEHADPVTRIASGVGDDEAQVRLDEPLAGSLTLANGAFQGDALGAGEVRFGLETAARFLALFHRLGESNLVFGGEQFVATDPSQILAE